MVNPVLPAANAFLGIYSVLPTPIKSLCALSVAIFVLSSVIKLIAD